LAHTLELQVASDGAEDDAEAPLCAAKDFEQLYALYFGFTWRVLRHLGVPSYAIDDVVQEVWIVVHQRLDSFQNRSSLKTWLFGIAFNVMRNQRRADERHAKLRTAPEPPREPPLDPEVVRAGREAWERVERFLHTLDEENRAIFVSSLLEHLPAKETAEATGVDVGTVYQRMRTLRNRFRAWLDTLDTSLEAGA
jgi:RNA polymerase sigma-70 factor, ECF subfamily